ncbi:MAG: F0F1 ATP synthase subunit delta [Gammaproteobacteria bacterium]|nr:F0F1 ATP synthase subunit delta [Gammaproteobacteria bacterium]
MAEKSTIARPYAQAVFDLASAQRQLGPWSERLQLMTAVVADPRLQRLIGNPRITRAQLAGLIVDICGDRLDAQARSLVGVLAENRRLDLLPEIGALFAQYRAEAEKTVQAEVVSAFPLSAEQQAGIVAALKRRLGREISLKNTTDGTLVGGAVIRAGDLVIDGSVTGHLDRLASALSH